MAMYELSNEEVQQLLNILATTKEWPWATTNPLLMKIGEQLRQHSGIAGAPAVRKETNSGPTAEH